MRKIAKIAISVLCVVLAGALAVWLWWYQARTAFIREITNFDLPSEAILVEKQERSVRFGAEGYWILVYDLSHEVSERIMADCPARGYKRRMGKQIAARYRFLSSYIVPDRPACIRNSGNGFDKNAVAILQDGRLIVRNNY